MRGTSLTYALAIMLVLLAGPSSAQQRIGVASMAKNEVAGIVAGQTRVIGTGAQVFQNEVVTTGANSSAQLLFRDQTTLTLGSNARMKLDRFVYDPNTQTGDIAIDIAEGAFRFMSGDAESQSYKIQTLTATTAVRGTIIAGHVNSRTRQVLLVLIKGAFDSTTPTTTVSLTKPGDYVVIDANGKISEPSAWKGPLLNIDADEQFLYDEEGNVVTPRGPRWRELNDAIDSREVDARFPQTPMIVDDNDKKDKKPPQEEPPPEEEIPLEEIPRIEIDRGQQQLLKDVPE